MPNSVVIPLVLDTASLKRALSDTEGTFADFGRSCGVIVKDVEKTADNVDITIPIKADNKPAKDSIRETEQVFSEYSGRILKIAIATGAAIAGAFAIKKGIDFGIEVAAQASVAQEAIIRLDGVLKSTGNTTGYTTDQLVDLAKSLELVTKYNEETIESSEAVLGIFNKLGGIQFERAVKSSASLATVLNTDLKSAALAAGKALQNPEEGLQSLIDIGVSFKEELLAQIKTLTESGKTVEAQTLILDTLDSKYKDVAETLDATFGEKVAKVHKRLDSFSEGIGEKLIKSLTNLEPTVDNVIELFGKFDASIERSLEAFGPLTDNVNDFLEELTKNLDVELNFLEGSFVAFADEGARIFENLFDGLIDSSKEVKGVHDYIEWFVDASVVSLHYLEDAFEESADFIDKMLTKTAMHIEAMSTQLMNFWRETKNMGSNFVALFDAHYDFKTGKVSQGKVVDTAKDYVDPYNNTHQTEHKKDLERLAKRGQKRSDNRDKKFSDFKERAAKHSAQLKEPKKPRTPKGYVPPKPPKLKKPIVPEEEKKENAGKDTTKEGEAHTGFEDLEALNKRIQAAASAADDPKIKSEQKVVEALNKVAAADNKLVEALQPKNERNDIKDVGVHVEDLLQDALNEVLHEGSSTQQGESKQNNIDEMQQELEDSMHRIQLYGDKEKLNALSDFAQDHPATVHETSKGELANELKELREDIDRLNKVIDDEENGDKDKDTIEALSRMVNNRVDEFEALTKQMIGTGDEPNKPVDVADEARLTVPQQPAQHELIDFFDDNNIEILKRNFEDVKQDLENTAAALDEEERKGTNDRVDRNTVLYNAFVEEHNRLLKLIAAKMGDSVEAQQKIAKDIPSVGSLKDN